MPLYLKNKSHGEVELTEGPIPVPGDGEFVAKVVAVAQNPTDSEQNALAPVPGSTVGYEFAGTVHSLGSNLTRSDLHLGDRVAGYAFGNCSARADCGAFGEYAIGYGHIAFKIPDGMSFEEAATLPVALVVAGQGVYQTHGGKAGEGKPLFIHAGSTTMGAAYIQCAKIAGFSPIVTTASPANYDYIKSLGADKVFDYKDPDLTSKVREATGGSLTMGIDARSRDESFKLVGDCLGPAGGTVVVLNLPPTEGLRADVEFLMSMSMSVIGIPFTILGYDIPAFPEHKAFMQEWWSATGEPAVRDGKIRPHRVKVMPGGLAGVKDGWKYMDEGKVSGVKLVYRIADTPGVA